MNKIDARKILDFVDSLDDEGERFLAMILETKEPTKAKVCDCDTAVCSSGRKYAYKHTSYRKGHRKIKVWTAREIARALELREAGKSIKYIARDLGRKNMSVHNKLRRLEEQAKARGFTPAYNPNGIGARIRRRMGLPQDYEDFKTGVSE